MMKLYVDDIRMPRDIYGDREHDWIIKRNYKDAIEFIKKNWDEITEISLDHDLGEEKSGYDVACFIEEMMSTYGYRNIIIIAHSMNPVGVKRILQVIESIQRNFAR